MVQRICNVVSLMILLSLVMSACGEDKPDTQVPSDPVQRTIEDEGNLTAFLDGRSGLQFVKEGAVDLAVRVLAAEMVDDSPYTVRFPNMEGVSQGPVLFRVVITESPYAYSLVSLPETSISPVAPMVKIHTNANCDITHSGFFTGCIGVPDLLPESGSYSSMMVTVGDWTSCGEGTDSCTEIYASVGQMELHRSIDCSDTTATVKQIYRYRCN